MSTEASVHDNVELMRAVFTAARDVIRDGSPSWSIPTSRSPGRRRCLRQQQVPESRRRRPPRTPHLERNVEPAAANRDRAAHGSVHRRRQRRERGGRGAAAPAEASALPASGSTARCSPCTNSRRGACPRADALLRCRRAGRLPGQRSAPTEVFYQAQRRCSARGDDATLHGLRVYRIADADGKAKLVQYWPLPFDQCRSDEIWSFQDDEGTANAT